jgi:hypothetical protein
VRVEEVRRAVQADSRLAGARRALHGDRAADVGAHYHVLLGLDGGDDVAHRTDTRPLDLRLEDRGVLLVRLAGRGQVLVLVGGQPPVLEAVPTAQGHPHRLAPRGAVEGQAHRRPPVHHHRLAARLGHVPAADVEALAGGPGRRAAVLGVVEPAEEERHVGVVGELAHPQLERGLQVLPAHPVGGPRGVHGGGALAHPDQLAAGRLQVRLFAGQLGRGRGHDGTSAGAGVGGRGEHSSRATLPRTPTFLASPRLSPPRGTGRHAKWLPGRLPGRPIRTTLFGTSCEQAALVTRSYDVLRATPAAMPDWAVPSVTRGEVRAGTRPLAPGRATGSIVALLTCSRAVV